MVLTSVPMSFAASVSDFTDVKQGDWFYESVKSAVAKGLMNGISPTEFDPNETMSRAMYVTVLSRMEGVTVDNNVSTPFEDVPPGQWYTGAVYWAYTEGIVKGYSNTWFGAIDGFSGSY